MPDKQIQLVMEIMDNIILLDDRKRKYTERQILNLPALLQFFTLSYRSTGIFVRDYEEYLGKTDLEEMPRFQTLSIRERLLDINAANK